jgi:hypothetical protein
MLGTEVEIRGEWNGSSCGGCFNHRTWVNNPNIFLHVRKNCTISFSLFQPLSNENDGKLMHHMSFYVFKTYAPQGRRQLKKVPESDIVCEGYYSNLRPNKGIFFLFCLFVCFVFFFVFFCLFICLFVCLFVVVVVFVCLFVFLVLLLVLTVQ